jgi:hypothetical protein
MGKFRVLVEAVGGHGCQREIKDGSEVYGCQRRDCPDCAAREFVAELKRKGNNVELATLTHWPEQPGQVIDDLLTRKRTGSF